MGRRKIQKKSKVKFFNEAKLKQFFFFLRVHANNVVQENEKQRSYPLVECIGRNGGRGMKSEIRLKKEEKKLVEVNIRSIRGIR